LEFFSHSLSYHVQKNSSAFDLANNMNTEVKPITSDTSIAHINTLADLSIGIDKNEQLSFSNYNAKVGLRSGFTVDTIKYIGFNICNVRAGMGDKKTIFSKDAALKIGVSPTTTYIVDFVEAKVIVNTNGVYLIILSSPLCGLNPLNTTERGYSVSMSGTTATMVTYLTHVKYDILGRTIDKWYPYTPASLSWNYGLLK